MNRTNNIFELVTVDPVPERFDDLKTKELILSNNDNIENNEDEKNLRLKGIHTEYFYILITFLLYFYYILVIH